jgi:beta-phosphoglucomutase-like phosphatase (HAD superfamily)
MTKGLRTVLFDMDGLLVDSEPLWFEAERSVMSRLGGPWAPADQLALIGGSLAHSVACMRARAVRPVQPEQIGRWLVDGMTELVARRGVRLMPGAARLLAGLAAAGIQCALVTSAERRIMEAVIASTSLAFSVTVCAEDVRRGKPDPEPTCGRQPCWGRRQLAVWRWRIHRVASRRPRRPAAR